MQLIKFSIFSIACRSLVVSLCLTLDIEERNESKTVSGFQVDLKHDWLRSTQSVVEVSKIDLTWDPQVLRSNQFNLNWIASRAIWVFSFKRDLLTAVWLYCHCSYSTWVWLTYFIEQIISCQSMNAEAVDVLKPMIMPIWWVNQIVSSLLVTARC